MGALKENQMKYFKYIELYKIIKSDLEELSIKLDEETDGIANRILFGLATGDLCEFYDNITGINLTPEELETKFEVIVSKYKHIYSEGGGEGGAEYCESVFKYGDKFYKVDYSYSSYWGYYTDTIWENIREVNPKQKVVTVYE